MPVCGAGQEVIKDEGDFAWGNPGLIRRHLNNEPVVACPPSAAYRFQKLVRRNKLAVAAFGAVLTALVLGLGLSTWLWLKEREAHRLAVLAEIKSQAKEKEARQAEAEQRRMVEFFKGIWIDRKGLPQLSNSLSAGLTDKIPSLAPQGDPRLAGRTYAQLAADWWKWSQMPLTNSSGAIHSLFDTPHFDISTSQTSDVWFLAALFGTTQRSCLIPAGKALFFPISDVESSNVEPDPCYGATAEDQADKAAQPPNREGSASADAPRVWWRRPAARERQPPAHPGRKPYPIAL